MQTHALIRQHLGRLEYEDFAEILLYNSSHATLRYQSTRRVY